MNDDDIWNLLLRVFAALLCVSAAIFLSVPKDSLIREASGATSALLAVVCIILAKLAKKFEAENEIQLVNQELKRRPIDSFHFDDHNHMDHDVDPH